MPIRSFFVLSLLAFFLVCSGCTKRQEPVVQDCPLLYGVAKIPTPLLNSPNFPAVFGGRNGKTVKVDKVGLCREVEVVILPGGPFTIDGTCEVKGRTVYRVTTPDYPYPNKKGYYVDGECLTIVETEPPARAKRLRHPTFIRYKLKSSLDSVYLWGGNWTSGIPEFTHFYPPKGPIYGHNRKSWILRGVDCSGLIYEATDGWTPRNASSLIRYGKAVPITGKTAEEICASVKPLDILGWRTHVMIFLDQENIIQSRVDYDYDTPGNQGGVRIQKAVDYVKRLLKSYDPVDDYDDEVPEGRNKFVIRRWYENEANK